MTLFVVGNVVGGLGAGAGVGVGVGVEVEVEVGVGVGIGLGSGSGSWSWSRFVSRVGSELGLEYLNDSFKFVPITIPGNFL